jgi:hypothetical protein
MTMATTNRGADGRPHGGLSTTDIDAIRTGLAAGRKPKVTFTEAAGQIAGQAGQVVQLTDPEQSEEWLVVRFGRDELPFSPADLAVPARGRPRKAQPPKGSPIKDTPVKETLVKKAAPPSPPPASPPPVPAPRTAAPAPATTAGSADPRRPVKRAAKSARAAKPKQPASMTVTIAYEAGEWTVAAHQGSKTLAKPYLIRSTEALRMVAMLDVPGVHEAVEQIVTAELSEAQRRADTLRSELAEVEARLAELRDVG